MKISFILVNIPYSFNKEDKKGTRYFKGFLL